MGRSLALGSASSVAGGVDAAVATLVLSAACGRSTSRGSAVDFGQARSQVLRKGCAPLGTIQPCTSGYS